MDVSNNEKVKHQQVLLSASVSLKRMGLEKLDSFEITVKNTVLKNVTQLYTLGSNSQSCVTFLEIFIID